MIRLPAIFAIAYGICAVAMFGVVWHRTECKATDSINLCTETRVIGSFLGAMLWPFSLSVIVQEQE